MTHSWKFNEPLLTNPIAIIPLMYNNTVFAAAAEMTEAEKAAEESAANAAEAEMVEAAAPYAPPEGSSGTLLNSYH